MVLSFPREAENGPTRTAQKKSAALTPLSTPLTGSFFANRTGPEWGSGVGKYPPAKPGALEGEPLEAVGGDADAPP
jgi:hypothetical protein